jgi:hypothetical protein
MAKTIRDTILAYPGLADCEDFLDNVVLPGRGFEGTEDSKTIDIKSWWPPTFIPWSAVCRTSRKTSSLSRIPVHGMTLRRNDYTGREENLRKRN